MTSVASRPCFHILAVEQVGRAKQKRRKRKGDFLLCLAHAEKLHQVVHRAAAHKGGPVLGLDALDGVLGANSRAAGCRRPGRCGVGVDVGAGGSAVIAGGTARVYIAGVAGVDGTLILRLFVWSRAGGFLACFGQRAAAMRYTAPRRGCCGCRSWGRSPHERPRPHPRRLRVSIQTRPHARTGACRRRPSASRPGGRGCRNQGKRQYRHYP